MHGTTEVQDLHAEIQRLNARVQELLARNQVLDEEVKTKDVQIRELRARNQTLESQSLSKGSGDMQKLRGSDEPSTDKKQEYMGKVSQIESIASASARVPEKVSEDKQSYVVEDAKSTSLSCKDSELLGVSLEWVLSKLRDSAWTRIQQKRDMPSESLWKHEFSNIKVGHDSGDFIKMKDLTKEHLDDLNFISLKTAVASGPTGVGYGTMCPRDGKRNSSIVDGLHASGASSRATIFMSWVWIYTVGQVLSGLESWYARSDDQQSVWWCFMCNNQYRLHSTIEDSHTLSLIFGERLVTIGRMLIMLDTIENPLYVTRCWCLFEVWKLVEKRMTNAVTVTLSRDGLDQLRKSFRSHQCDLENCLLIDSRKAEASQELDKRFIMEQIGDRHDEVGRVVKKQLLILLGQSIRDWVPETATTQDRLRTMIERLELGANVQLAEEKDLVVLIGNTGSAKSTTVNFLHGCEMEGFRDGARRKVRVSETSRQREVAPIGHTNLSKTDFPHITELKQQCGSLFLCDCPGFVDQRGSDISIANVHNINKAICVARSVRFLVTISYSCIVADRGKGADELLYSLLELFGGSVEALKANKDAILLCVTKAPLRDQDEGFEITRDALLSHFKNVEEVTTHFKNSEIGEVFTSICRDAVVYNPLSESLSKGWLRKGALPKGWLSREEFLISLTRMKSVQNHASICVVAPNANEISSMRNLVKNMSDEMDEQIKNSCFKDADRLVQELSTWKDLLFVSQRSAPSMKLIQVEIEKVIAESENQLKGVIRTEIEVQDSLDEIEGDFDFQEDVNKTEESFAYAAGVIDATWDLKALTYHERWKFLEAYYRHEGFSESEVQELSAGFDHATAWQCVSGFIAKRVERKKMSIDEAKEECKKIPDCIGFYYKGIPDAPTDRKMDISFGGKSKVATSSFSTYTSWILQSPGFALESLCATCDRKIDEMGKILCELEQEISIQVAKGPRDTAAKSKAMIALKKKETCEELRDRISLQQLSLESLAMNLEQAEITKTAVEAMRAGCRQLQDEGGLGEDDQVSKLLREIPLMPPLKDLREIQAVLAAPISDDISDDGLGDLLDDD